MKPPKPACKNCQHAYEFDGWIDCRRYPPCFNNSFGTRDNTFPCVKPSDSCGEFRKKRKPKPN